MKKVILTVLATVVASITMNQLISNQNSITTNNIKIEENLNSNLNKDNYLIDELDKEYASRSKKLNENIKNNLIDSIMLINNQITINYQNLNKNLYSEAIYQAILSVEYLNTLKMQQELNLISFDSNNHINFDKEPVSKYGSDIWMETHWYWFVWAKIHFSYNGIWKILNMIQRVGENPAGKAAAITAFLFTQLSIATVLAIALGVFLVASYFVLLGYSNNLKGCWIGILTVVPGAGWGSN